MTIRTAGALMASLKSATFFMAFALACAGPILVATLAIAEQSNETAAAVEAPRTVALLGVFLQNDNEEYEPTSDAERARMTALDAQFKAALEETGRYKFVTVTPDVAAKINSGQTVGECGGCEIEFGKALGANTIAWVRVQKISNLIMNLNVYLADVTTNKMLFLHSVDIRGNSDQSWSRSMSYLLKNYMLSPATKPGG